MIPSKPPEPPNRVFRSYFGWEREVHQRIFRTAVDHPIFPYILLIRLGMVVPGLVLLWLMRKRAWARALAVSLAWMYFILLGWHVYGRVAYFG